MRQLLKKSLLLLAPLLFSGVAAAQSMYKWTDENGRITYSDQPPVGKVRSKEIINVPASSNPGAARTIGDQDAQFKKRQDDAAKAQVEATKKADIEKQRADNCSRARAELRGLRENAPMVRLMENGERVILDDSARDAEGKRLSAYLEESCAQQGG
ncbi:MAG: DUF4124 domain-containing protein [Casimicrobiaceae bacterium]